jgi:hypothetical protein
VLHVTTVLLLAIIIIIGVVQYDRWWWRVTVDFVAVDFVAVDFVAVNFVAVNFVAVDFIAVDFVAVDFDTTPRRSDPPCTGLANANPPGRNKARRAQHKRSNGAERRQRAILPLQEDCDSIFRCRF